MNTAVRRLATLAYLRSIDRPASARVSLRADALEAIVRALFHEEQRADEAEAKLREQRLDAAEARADEIFHSAPRIEAEAESFPRGLARAGSRRRRSGRPTPHAKPTGRHPGTRQKNLPFLPALARHPGTV